MNQNLIDALKNVRPSWESKTAQDFSSIESQIDEINSRISKVENASNNTFQLKELKSDEDKTPERQLIEDIAEQAAARSEEFRSHPWKISLRTVPETDPPQYEFKVDLRSSLYLGLENWDEVSVSGLDSWQEANIGFVVLAGDVENYQCTGAEVLFAGNELTERVEFTGSSPNQTQTKFYAKLGRLVLDGEGIAVVQDAFHNFTLMQNCVDSVPVIYPFAT